MRTLPFVVATALATGACVTGPVSGSEYEGDYDDIYSPHVAVGGFVRDPGATVVIEAKTSGGGWHAISSIEASTRQTFAAGAFCPNSPALFSFSDPDADGFQWFLNPDWQYVEPGLKAMTIRAHQADGPNGGLGLLFTERDDSVDCMLQYAGRRDCDFYNVAVECGYAETEATIYLRMR
jgi:hypothetical protein